MKLLLLILMGILITSIPSVFALEVALAPILSIPENDILFEVNERITSEDKKLKTSKIYESLASAKHIIQISPLFKINTNIFNNEYVVIPYFDGQQTFQTTSITKETESKFIWKGHVEKSSDYAIIIVTENNVVGNIHINEILYSIEPLGEGYHVLVKVNFEEFIDERPDWKTIPIKPTNWFDVFEMSVTQIPLLIQQKQIDIMVLYTENVAGLVLDIDAKITLALEETNDSHVNSDSNAKYRVVHTEEIDYTSVGLPTDIDKLENPMDVELGFVHDLRDDHGADIVLLFTDDPDWCGEAADIGVDESQAFAVVDYYCATGYYSFGHEIGHIHGARHIIENDPADEPFEHGHGLCDPDTSNDWRTIMSYNCDGMNDGDPEPRIQYWSNPDVTFGGDSLGTEELQDNARVMDETFEYVCSFRDPNCVTIIEWLERVTIFEENFEFCFSGFPSTGGLSAICINEFDPCGCGINAPICENMLCPDYGNLQELVIFTQLQEFRPYKLIDLGVEPNMILPKDGMVMLDSDIRDKPIRVKYTSAERLIDNNPSWSIRLK